MAIKNRPPLNFANFHKRGVNTTEAKGWVILAGVRRHVSLCAHWSGEALRERLWHVTAHHTIPGVKAPITATVRHHGVRWQAAELALLGLEIEIQKEGI